MKRIHPKVLATMKKFSAMTILGFLAYASSVFIYAGIEVEDRRSVSELSALRMDASPARTHAAPMFNASAARITKRLGERLEIDEVIITRSSGSGIFARNSKGVVKVMTNEGQGAGSILSDSGLILTNYHVIEGYETVAVRFLPNDIRKVSTSKLYFADVLRVDEIADLALIQLTEIPGSLVIIRGATSIPPIGSDVHAIGHPHGQDWSYTRGYISQIRPDHSWSYDDGVSHQAEIIQTQTPINPGNSGGPLFDDVGQLIGVNTYIDASGQGLNYAVSIHEVQRFLAENADRYAPKSTKPVRLYPIDLNDDGEEDGAAYDVSGNGEADMFMFPDPPGEDFVILFDLDGNGDIDAKVSPERLLNGEIVHHWYFDTTGNGEWDTEGVDVDLDGTPDTVAPIS